MFLSQGCQPEMNRNSQVNAAWPGLANRVESVGPELAAELVAGTASVGNTTQP